MSTAFGLHPYLSILCIVIFFLVGTAMVFQRIIFPEIIYSGICFFVVLLFSEKRRNNFLKHIFPKERFTKIRIFENVVTSLPFCVGIVIMGNYLYTILPLIISFGLSYYNQGGRLSTVIPTPFGKNPFEFIVGFRKWVALYLCLFLVFAISLYVGNYKLGLFCLSLTLLLCLDFYSKYEKQYFLWIHNMDSRAFIHEKIRVALKHAVIISLPFYTLLICFYVDCFLSTIGVLLVLLFYIIFIVLFKYSAYPMGPHLKNILILVCSILFPVLMVFLFPYFYNKSIVNVKLYLS